MSKGQETKNKILQAALEVLQEGGVKHLSQPKVAKAAGVRQSNLTYYFPKKNDLIAGLMQQHIDFANKRLESIKSGNQSVDLKDALHTLVNDRKRMRFFLGLIIEGDADPEVRKMVTKHVKQFQALVALYFGREENDPQIEAFLNTLRGYGMMNLLSRSKSKPIDVSKIAETYGLIKN
ncbi:MAG: TetR/AcrR family transcriptional regulator [Rhizobiales bacterium]|nr:TetR/AcrR family transcriptional regulator [Hyphomicrobiales bacterium]